MTTRGKVCPCLDSSRAHRRPIITRPQQRYEGAEVEVDTGTTPSLKVLILGITEVFLRHDRDDIVRKMKMQLMG
jgi:hypothetical protein